jgi:transcriptional regulator with XRE-family HTH domain
VEGELQVQFGKNLRAYRRQRQLTQEKFGQLLGYNRTYIGGLERGERNVTLRTVERLAACLGVDPGRLLDDHRAQS